MSGYAPRILVRPSHDVPKIKSAQDGATCQSRSQVERLFGMAMMEWVGASVIAPRPHTPIEFEIAWETGIRTGNFHDSMFYSDGDPAGYPRRMIRRWRYVDEASARGDFACAISA